MDRSELKMRLETGIGFTIHQQREIMAEVERLKAENEKLKANQELWGSIELITAQRKEKEQLRETLERLAGHVGRMGRDIIDEALKDSP